MERAGPLRGGGGGGGGGAEQVVGWGLGRPAKRQDVQLSLNFR